MKCFVYDCKRDAGYEVRVRSLRDEWNSSNDYFLCRECWNQMGNDLNLFLFTLKDGEKIDHE